jgi:hypothetical protein
MNWNEEIIKMMVDNMQPREERMDAETEMAFRALIASTQQGLSHLQMKLEGSWYFASESFIADQQQDSTGWATSSKHLTDVSETWSTKSIPSPLGSLTNFSKL